MAIDTAMETVHLLFGAVWVGAVVFVTVGVLPQARDGNLTADAFEGILGRLRWLTRIGAVLLLVTGSHLAATRYTADRLFSTGDGHLVLTMVALWLALAATVEIGSSRITDGLNSRKLREPARNGTRWFQVATLIGIALLVVSALLS